MTVPEPAPSAVDETNKNEDTDMGVFGDQGMGDVLGPTGGQAFDFGVMGQHGLNQPMATDLQLNFVPQQNMLGGLGGAQWDQPYL